MPSAPLSPDNDYRFPPAPAEALLNRAIWDLVMAGTEPGKEGIGPRIRALEAKRTELQAIVDDLRLFGLERLDTAIVPLINATKEEIEALQQAVAQTIEQNGQVIEDFQIQIAAALQSLNDDLDALREQVDLILAGGIPAANVAESSQRVFLSPTQKAEIGALRNDLDALDSAIDGALASLSSAIGGKQSTSEKNVASGYAGLGTNGKVLASLLGTNVVVQTFNTSATFAKEADDIAYWVECIGGGQSGQNGLSIANANGETTAGGFPGKRAAQLILASEIAATVVVTVGAGGVPSNVANTKVDGGTSTFGALVGALGGAGPLLATQNIAAQTLGQYLTAALSEGFFYTRGLMSAAGGSSTMVSSADATRAGPGTNPITSVAAGALGGIANGDKNGVAATVPGGGGGGGMGINSTGGQMGNGGNGALPGGGGGGGASAASNYSGVFGKGGNGGSGQVRVYRFKK